MAVVCVMGLPCSGKTTIKNELANILSCSSLSTGDIVRNLGVSDEDRNNCNTLDLSLELNDHINKTVLGYLSTHDTVVLDGYPRSAEQVELLMRLRDDVIIVWLTSATPAIMHRAELRGREFDTKEVMLNRVKSSLRLYRHINTLHQALRGWKYLGFSLDYDEFQTVIDKVCENLQRGNS